MADLSTLKPQPLWNNFSDLCKIPRPSKHEEETLRYLESKCDELGLEHFRDKVGNLIVRKNASPGHEHRKGIILQSHVDMVPQKNSDKEHDFTKDPITTIFDGDWLKADGTTLGADNGMGVAATLAALQDQEIQHGPLEALFTIDEETGMTGALGLEPGVLQGEILINLDSEDNGEIFIGCAGGVDLTLTGKAETFDIPADWKGAKISLTGLKGGHSGVDIHLNRGNAAIALHTLLKKLSDAGSYSIVKLQEGTLRNAIPREAFAEIALPAETLESLKSLAEEFVAEFDREYADRENPLRIEIEEQTVASVGVSPAWSDSFSATMSEASNGVAAMHPDFPGVVETSSNIGVVKIEDSIVELVSLVRSSSEQGKKDLAKRIAQQFSHLDLAASFEEDYPGWSPNKDSYALKTVLKTHQELFGKPGEIKVIHAGLECGILGATYPNWDMISIGPTIRYPHSPDERVLIPTVEGFWQLLKGCLEAL